MPEIAAAQTAADMTYAKPHAFMPTGGSNRRAARMQAAALRRASLPREMAAPPMMGATAHWTPRRADQTQ